MSGTQRRLHVHRKAARLVRDKTEVGRVLRTKDACDAGGETEDDKEITLPNRTLIWTSGSITFEADPKHVRDILFYFKFDSTSKVLRAPIVKETKEEVTEEEVELGPYVATEFRGLAARANYLSLDRPDIQFATKEYAGKWPSRRKEAC